MNWLCLVLVLGLIELSQGYTTNSIKDYNSQKDYTLSNAVSRFEDNEIRGEFTFTNNLFHQQFLIQKKTPPKKYWNKSFVFFLCVFEVSWFSGNPKGENTLFILEPIFQIHNLNLQFKEKKIKYINKKFIKQQKKETKNVKIIIIRQETLIRNNKKDYGCVYKNVK